MINAEFVKEIANLATVGRDIQYRGQRFILGLDGKISQLPSALKDLVKTQPLAVSSLVGFVEFVKSSYNPITPQTGFVSMKLDSIELSSAFTYNGDRDISCFLKTGDRLPPALTERNLEDFLV